MRQKGHQAFAHILNRMRKKKYTENDIQQLKARVLEIGAKC